jgi:NADPH2:quinone reductase
MLGAGVRDFKVGDRVADMTVIGSNAAYRTLWADDLARVRASSRAWPDRAATAPASPIWRILGENGLVELGPGRWCLPVGAFADRFLN